MNRKNLVQKLTLGWPALADNAMVPVLQCYQFTKKLIVATDGAVGVNIPTKTDDAFAVNGKVLLGLLNNSQADDVELSVENGDLIVEAGKSHIKLPVTTEGEDFLLIGDNRMKANTTIPLTREIITGLDNCLVTSSKDQSQGALMGVTIHAGKNEDVVLYSCDSDALTRYIIADSKGPEAKDVMLPNKFCSMVVKVAAEIGLGKEPVLEVNSEWAKATLGQGYVVHGRVVENDNPLNHADVIKKTFKGDPSFMKKPEGLYDALSRAMVVGRDTSAKTVLTLSGGNLHLSTRTHIGEVEDDLLVSPGNPDVTAEVNAELLLRTLNICDEIAITDRCVAYRNASNLFQIISNVSK